MKNIVSIATIFTLLFTATSVFITNSKVMAQGAGSQAQQKTQVSPSSTGNQVQNQVETQNQGEDSQIQTNTQEQENLGGNQETQGQGIPKVTSPRSETATQSMSIVAQKVEELLTTQAIKGGIGQQVKVIAQEQKSAQEQIQAELGKVDSRGGLLKAIIGPNFGALKNMQKQMEQNQLRIQKLEELQSQLVNQEEITQVQEAIQAIVDQNVALQDRVALEEKSFSAFGWLFKFFAN